MKSIILLVALAFSLSAQALIKVKGADGVTVILNKPAHRVVSLAPNVTESLFYVGAGKYVVGVDEYSDYPAAATKLPKVASVRSVNTEAVLALKPDVVVAWKEGTSAQDIVILRRLGLQVLVVDPTRIVTVFSMLKQLGELTDTLGWARSRILALASRYRQLLRSHFTKRPLSVFIQIAFPPLYTVGEESIQSEVVQLCGGRNIFHLIHEPSFQVKLENVIKMNPEVIIASQPANFHIYNSFPELRAVKRKAMFEVNADNFSRAGPRIIQAAVEVCKDLDSVRDSNTILGS